MTEIQLQAVTLYTRAGKRGKSIICPECDGLSSVYNFSWSQLRCRHCGKDIKKTDWLVQPKAKSNPTQCTLCGRRTIYKTKIEHPYYREPGVCYWCGFVQSDWLLIKNLANPIELQCPWMVTADRRCQHKTVFSPEQLTHRYTYPCYGDTPYYYPDMKVTCPSCDHYTTAIQLILNNMDVIKLAQTAVPQEAACSP